MKKTQKKDEAFFPYGTQYYRAPTPLPEEWEGDLKAVAKAGYTHVQFRPQWRWHERIRGRTTWDDIDMLFDIAEKNGLRVILKPMLETAPDWVFNELGGVRVGFHGVTLDPVAPASSYVGGWLPCFDNPNVIEAASGFVRLLVRRFHRHSALWFYNAWNEPVSRPLGQCQCIHSINSYRKWLQQSYGTIDDINNCLGKAWTSYETILPPVSSNDYLEVFLWRKWAAWAVAQQIRFVVDAIRSVDKHAFIITHGGGASVMQDPAWAASDDVLNASMTDRYGISFPLSLQPQSPLEHAQADYQSDWLRRVDNHYWCYEFYPNRACWCRPPEPHTLRRHIWMAIAGGCAGFTFWQYRSERFGVESNGYGLREIDGSQTERGKIADDIAGLMQKFGSRINGTKRPVSQVALLYSRDSDLLMRIQHMKQGLFNLASESGDDGYAYKRALKSAHLLYMGNGHTVDWVIPGDDISQYAVVHVTAAEMIDENTAEWLKCYVKNGGRLVVEFPFACRDEKTWVTGKRPAHELEFLLGCREISRVVIPENEVQIAEFSCKIKIPARGWKIELQPTEGKCLAQWQDKGIAAVRHQHGSGVVYSLGANVSLTFTDTWDDPCFSIYSWILKDTGIKPFYFVDRGVWIRRRKSKDREIWFVFNLSNVTKEISLPVKPADVFDMGKAKFKSSRILLDAGGFFVAEFPVAS